MVIAVERQILMCDTTQELLLLSFAMMNKAKDLLDEVLGQDQRKHLFKEHV
jgi:hypothetical protein